ncbi:MAG TPA: hypothetical protein VGQ46_01215 [Thermoanaerobaculia bacterium]|jgi:hypothetical protein|nr:hypothetical protein [Thermoanaerobaculia bacterium]
MLLRGLRFLAGLTLGVWIWWAATPAYNYVLAPATQLLLHADRRFAEAVLVPQERKIFITSATPLPTATMPADQLTYNIILLLALFASNDRTWRFANLRGLGIALVILFVSHCIGLVISIESTYAVRQGAWSDQHYGDAAANFWLTAEVVFRIVGMFGVVFASWWALSYAKRVST